ncbi:MAG: DUF1616 domain-containing protein [Chloroflexota bacterium]
MWIVFDLFLLILINLNWFLDLGVALNVSAAFISLFFAPGYFLLNLMFAEKFPFTEQLKYPTSFGLSVVISGLTLLLLSFFGISRQSLQFVLYLLNILGLISMGIRLFHKQDIKTSNIPNLLKRGKSETVLVVSFLIALFLIFISFSWFWGKTEETTAEFTEFYILGMEGRAADYVSEVEVNSPFEINVGIENHEGEGMNYSVFALTEAGVVGHIESVLVPDGAQWEDKLMITLDSIGENLKVKIYLSCEGCDFPYRQLTSWVTVIESGEEDLN